ncbi:MAG: GH3 auxin-responsive promoter family protein [Alphaproteobacteria bacterium]|nr:GH3 auxin-responsive promoter family protein [Alphaproteobacteria bacterium]
MRPDATPLFRLYAAWRGRQLAALHAVASQRRQLLKLVGQATATRFGREHGFDAIREVPDYLARVPLRRYEDFWRDWWQPAFPRLVDVSWPGLVPFFAVTSGTTSGRSKYIPVTAAMCRSNVRAGLDVIVHHLLARPRSRAFAGRAFMLGGASNLTPEAPGVASGDLSGIAVATTPRWARPFGFPDRGLALLKDWDIKIERLANAALNRDIRILTGTPSWLLILLDRMRALRQARGQPPAPFPKLELLLHGGVDFRPYRHRFGELLGSHVDYREVYPASEGFIASADRGPGEGLRLNLDNGLFYEFVPSAELAAASPRRHWLGDAELGVDYALALSTCAGAWSYLLGDTVRLVSRDPPRLAITGRVGQTMSAFGEHLIVEEVEAAIAAAAGAIGADVTDYALGARLPATPGALSHHVYVVEFATAQPSDAIVRFAATLDTHLSDANDDYRGHRGGGFGLGAPQVLAVAPGFFAGWMRARGQLGGQHKVPRIVNDASLFATLLAAAGARGSAT